MTDARFPERWLNDRRIVRLPDDAFRLFMMSLAWSVANKTDGRLYDDDLPLIPGVPRSVVAAYTDEGLAVVPLDPPAAVQKLVKAELWERVADYWLITDFEDTQTSRSDLELLANGRRTEAASKRRRRHHASGDHSLCVDCGHVQGDSPGGHVRGDTPRTGQARTGKG